MALCAMENVWSERWLTHFGSVYVFTSINSLLTEKEALLMEAQYKNCSKSVVLFCGHKTSPIAAAMAKTALSSYSLLKDRAMLKGCRYS